ncbi:MAG TPA: hypothetical protein DCR04_08935 [Flavobacteriales bacterium]|nr:hypothetical protein [Flavobacteriales bacterium]
MNCGQNQLHFEKGLALPIRLKDSFENGLYTAGDGKKCKSFEYWLYTVVAMLDQPLCKEISLFTEEAILNYPFITVEKLKPKAKGNWICTLSQRVDEIKKQV